MSVPNDGGPAFPCGTDTGNDRGISARAYLAAKAMQGMISANAHLELASTDEEIRILTARYCCKMADALIAELEGKAKAIEQGKFKKGDRIRILEDSKIRPSIKKGRLGTVVFIYTVLDGSEWRYNVYVDGDHDGVLAGFTDDEIESIEHGEPKFKKGDRVRVAESVGGKLGGKIAVVERLVDGPIAGCSYRVWTKVERSTFFSTVHEDCLEAAGEEGEA